MAANQNQCPACGHKNASTRVKCMYCGANLQQASKNELHAETAARQPDNEVPRDVRAILLGVSSAVKAREAINSLSFARVVGDEIEVASGVELTINVLIEDEGVLVCATGNPSISQLREFKRLARLSDPRTRDLAVRFTRKLLETVKETGGGTVWYVS